MAATVLLGIAIIGPRRRRPLGGPAFCVLALLAGMVACGGGGSGSAGVGEAVVVVERVALLLVPTQSR